jgi:hypothetical protein
MLQIRIFSVDNFLKNPNHASSTLIKTSQISKAKAWYSDEGINLAPIKLVHGGL